MQETRKLASNYYQTTGQILPVTQELAKYDAITLLKLEKSANEQNGIDAIGKEGFIREKPLLIKGRAIFTKKNMTHRIGQLNMNENWDYLLLVLYDEFFEVNMIYCAKKTVLNAIVENKQKQNKRGMLSVNQFKAVSTCVWPVI